MFSKKKFLLAQCEDSVEKQLEKVCQEINEEPEKEKINEKPVNEQTLDQNGISDSDFLFDDGVITQSDKIYIIDEKYPLKSIKYGKERLKKGTKIRYSYTLDEDYRILNEIDKVYEDNGQYSEVNNGETKPDTNVTSWDTEKETTEEAKYPIPTVKVSEQIPETNKIELEENEKYLDGTVKSISVNQDIIEIEFDSHGEFCTSLSKIYKEFSPNVDDRVQLRCTVSCDDNDEDKEVVEDITILSALKKKSGSGEVIELNERYGIVGPDIKFKVGKHTTDLNEKDTVDFEAILTANPKWQWRCIKITPVERTDDKELKQGKSEDLADILAIEDVLKDRDGIVIENRDLIAFRFRMLDEKEERKLKVINRGKEKRRLISVIFKSSRGGTQLKLKVPKTMHPMWLREGEFQEFVIEARAFNICNHNEYVILLFDSGLTMAVEVPIATGSDRVIQNILVHYNSHRRPPSQPVDLGPVRDTVRVARPTPKFVFKRLPSCPVPENIRRIMNSEEKNTREQFEEELPYLVDPLSPENYAVKQQFMVHIDEAYLAKWFRIYNRDDARFQKEGENFSFLVDNLAESRPSILVGDMVEVRKAEATIKFSGLIHKIYHDRIIIKFDKMFNEHYKDQKFHMSFRYSRGLIQKQQYAISVIKEKMGTDVLFPSEVLEKHPLVDVFMDDSGILIKNQKHDRNQPTKKLTWHNPDLNEYQKEVIVNALRGECRPLPQLISGPPGTGKTSTLVELVLQTINEMPGSHILVCTPSNSAANLILEKLKVHLLRADVIRLIGHQVMESETTPEELKKYCGTVDISMDRTEGKEMDVLENGMRINCQAGDLRDFRIIIVTIGSVGSFMQMDFPNGHFTHLFVDEAGQCLESEIIIPMTLLNKETGHMVFVGDEKQLGPIVLFKPLELWNYGLSYFERLQQFPIYDRKSDQWDKRLSFQLVYNYRSIPSILKTYSKLFYDETLKPKVTNIESEEFKCLDNLQDLFEPSPFRDKHFGVFFFAVTTVCRRSKMSPSWLNPGETTEVVNFYKKLLDKGVRTQDVGIISPYQEQVRSIRDLISSYDLKEPKVGSVEEFQGQERKIILISTVRSNSKHIQHDKPYMLGFVGNQKRVNVSISRAQSLLVIFGNPSTLRHDEHWRHIVKYCEQSDAYFEVAKKE